jgi:hypothetical protein
MDLTDLSRAKWRTASRSGTNGNCVEVAVHADARVLVRDTKDRDALVLAFGPNAWRWFTDQTKAGTQPA